MSTDCSAITTYINDSHDIETDADYRDCTNRTANN
jgi:hypothetical protein